MNLGELVLHLSESAATAERALHESDENVAMLQEELDALVVETDWVRQHNHRLLEAAADISCKHEAETQVWRERVSELTARLEQQATDSASREQRLQEREQRVDRAERALGMALKELGLG